MASKNEKKLIYQLEAQNAKYLKKIEQSQRKLARFAKQTGKDTRFMRKRFESLDRAAVRLGATLAAVLGARASAANITNTIKLGREINNLSALANTASGDFQKLGYAAERYGVSQEKVADILKDTSDKIGDFLQTGGGPLADFFENIGPRIGVTAEQFRNLSSDQALGLYVKSLEKANVSQNEMTFFMEAIASDATLLLPLFRNNARELEKLGNEAEKLGAVFSSRELATLEAVNVSMDELRGAFAGLNREVTFGALPAIEKFTALLADPGTINAAQALANTTVSAFEKMTAAVTKTINLVQFLGEALSAKINGAAYDDVVRSEEEINKLLTQREHLLKQIERAETNLLSYQRGPAIERFQQQIDAIDQEIAARRAVLRDLNNSGTARGVAAGETVPGVGATDLSFLKEISVSAQRRTLNDFRLPEEIKRAEQITEAARTPLEDLIGRYNELQELLEKGLITKETFDRTVAGINASSKSVDKLGDQVSEFAQQAKRNLQDGLVDVMVNGFEDGTQSMLDSFTNFLKRAAAELAASKILELFSGGQNAAGSAIGDFFAGFFADGGRIPAGQFGVVGERGPELVSGPAAVQPMGRVRGDNVTINIDARNADPLAAAQLRQLGQTLKREIINTLYDRKARGRF